MKKILLIIVTFLTLHIQAQWVNDTLLCTPVSVEVNNQRDLRIESDGDGGAFLAWKDYRNGTSNPDIMIQRVDSAGNMLWTINGSEVCIQSADQSTPTITSDGQGGVIVAWSDWRSGIERDIYAQRIDGNGNLLWQTNGAPVTTKNEREHSEKIISDDHSGIIVVWEQQRQFNFTWDIWAQRIDSLGNPVWQNGGIPLCYEGSNRRNHKVKRDRNGGAYIVWQDERNGAGEYDIYAQHIDENGTLLWDSMGLVVCNASGGQTNAKMNPEKTADGIYVTWVDKRNGIDYDIYANRIDSNGNVMWGSTGLPVVTEIGNQTALDGLSNNKTQGLIVTWKDKRVGNYDIYIQKLDIDGNKMWNSSGVVVCDANGHQKNPNIISDKNGGAIITWQDKRDGNYDIFAQRISYNAKPIWKANGEPICRASGKQSSPKNVPDNKGGTIIAWDDRRQGFFTDIYISHILFEDTVTYPQVDTIPNDTIINDTIDTTSIFVIEEVFINVYPNPFTNKIIVEFDKLRSSNFDFKLIDILGREIQIETIEKYKNRIVINVDRNSIENGTYFLIIQTEKSVSSIPLVKD